MDNSRRRVLLSTLFGAGGLGLRALATGLPLGLFASSRRAYADPAVCANLGITNPQFLVLFTSQSGDPLNANVPGCYVDPGIYHPTSPNMTPTSMTLGSKSWNAALPWTQLDPGLLQRACFFHHATYTNAHGDAPKVQKVMGAVMRQEMMVSLYAASLAGCMGTVQTQPVVLSQNLISASGAVLPVLNPLALKSVLSSPTGVLATLQQQRDTDVNKLYTLFKANGRKADAAILDQYALSQQQARSLSQTLLGQLSTITGTTRADLATAASVLIQMKVSPAIVMTYSFGGDNHADPGLAGEATQTAASLSAVNAFYTTLKGQTLPGDSTPLSDKVTIAMQNVFGRTLSTKSHSNNADGRNHNDAHHCSVFFGKAFTASVIGGVTQNASATDYRATGIASADGSSSDGGDVPYEQTLASAAKTLGKALGVPQTVLDTQITTGKVVPAALAS